MPKVLIVADADLKPLLGRTVLWSKGVERVLTPSSEAAFEVGQALVPSLLVLEAVPPRSSVALVRRLRAHAGLRRSSIAVVTRADVLPEEAELLAAGANLVLKGPLERERWDSSLRGLLSVPRRLRLRFPVTLERSGGAGGALAGQVLDISSHGVLVESEGWLPAGTGVELRFRLPGQSDELSASGIVVRVVPGKPARQGIRFLQLAGPAETCVRSLLASIPQERSFGRYEPLGLIGEGSMGRVYRAFDPAAQRVVAIKTLRPELLEAGKAEEYLGRFRREAQAAAQLVHPNIVTIFDVGDDYFVMELIEGATLQTLFRERGRLALQEACALLRPVAAALDHAHAAGTIHRDIKPANIMVTSTGRPMVMDFGVAHLMSGAITASGLVLGSPAYMAPEQVTGGELSPQTDLFSLAVVAYEALTGRRAFEARALAGLLHGVVNSDPAPPSTHNAGLSPACDEVFRRALAKDPGQRFPTANALVDALAAVTQEAQAPALSSPVEGTAGEAGLAPESFSETLDLRAAAAAGWRWRQGAAARGLALSLLVLLGAIVGQRAWRAWPAAASGGLSVTTNPAGAKVWLDGRLAGRSPLVLAAVQAGTHAVRIEQPDYAPADLTLIVPQGAEHLPLSFTLRPLSASLLIDSQPAPAWVRIDGQNLGATPLAELRLASGPHQVELERAGHRPWSERVELAPGERRRLMAQLKRDPRAPRQTALQRDGWVRLGDLVALGAGVKPPRRLSGEPAGYPQAARALRLEGTVSVEFTVDVTGGVGDVRVVQSAGELLDEALLEAVAGWRYEPAESNGVKVRVRLREQQRFDPPPAS